MKVIRDSSQAKEVEALMRKKGVVIFFFMEGCSHCEATRPAWEQLSQSGLPYEFAEVESAAVSPQFGIQGFPHFHMKEKSGKVVKVDGEKTTKDDLAKALGIKVIRIPKLLRRTRRGNARRFIRRIRKTLR